VRAGSETWFAIPQQYYTAAMVALREWLLDRGGADQGLAPAVDMKDAELLDFLFYSKRLNPPTGIFTQKGIPVYRTDRHAGSMLIATGSTIHWGYNTHNYTVARAVNILPRQWLQVRVLLVRLGMTIGFCLYRLLVCASAW
jgi:hypothetical protein